MGDAGGLQAAARAMRNVYKIPQNTKQIASTEHQEAPRSAVLLGVLLAAHSVLIGCVAHKKLNA